MKHLTQKLKSQRGASMLFALLVFLLCMLAGTAALTAAAANVGRYAHLEDEQRQYFSTSSALALLQAELDAAVAADPADPDAPPPLTVTATYTETQNWYYDATGSATTPTYGTPDCELTLSPKAEDLNYYQRLLLQNCVPTEWRSAYTGPSGGSFPTLGPSDVPPKLEYTIKPGSDFPPTGMEDAADSLYPVKVTLNGAPNSYTLQMDLTTGDDDAYPLHVVWSGEAETETKGETTTTGDPDAPSSSGTRKTVTTLTCTLRWPIENRAVTFNN